ncbi:hypothetical protein CK938_05295 [Bacillus cereus]|nr:hypothetical protein CK938_05295 [Bacillus cereus]
MTIKKLYIKNSKSITEETLNLKEINCLIGENGSGKSNVIRAIEYFYSSLTDNILEVDLFDKKNPFNDYIEVSMTYDFELIQEKAYQFFNNAYRLFDDLDSAFFEKVYKLSNYVDANKELTLKLRKYKNNQIEWIPNIPYSLRSFIKNIFPVYSIKARHLNLTHWDDLWSIIGDLSKLQVIDFHDDLEKFFGDIYGTSYSSMLTLIKDELQSNDIEFSKFNLKERFIKLLQIQLNGEFFNHKDEKLDYFSDGINSYNFLKLLNNLARKISNQKLKNPLIIIDEPETGLHPQYIDKLIESYTLNNGKPQILLATHSQRILKNIIKKSDSYIIYHVSYGDEYTKITKMNKPTDSREIFKISDEEAGYFFSRGIVFIEGFTENELFSNKNIIKMFPFLEKIDFLPIDGNTVKLDIVHPNKKKINIPYLLVVDSDQIYAVDKRGRLKLPDQYKEVLNPLADENIRNREKFYYGKKRSNTYEIRKRIEGLMENCNLQINKYWWFVYGSYLGIFNSLVKKYCLEYNVYPVTTTIEGALVNSYNIDVFIEWLKIKNPHDAEILMRLYNFKEDIRYKTTVLRLIVNGKYEIHKTKKQFFKKNKMEDLPEEERKNYLTIAKWNSQFEKTNGWVTDWINYVFDTHINTELSNKQREEKFKFYFGEIFDIIIEVRKKCNVDKSE